MTTTQLTVLINNRLDRLRHEVNTVGAGGGLEHLAIYLRRIRAAVQSFIDLIDKIDGDA